MNPRTYTYTSSRGRTLEGKLFCQHLYVKPGANLRQLCDKAYDDLKDIDGNKIVYFIAGIPDICSVRRANRYQESCLEIRDSKGEKINHMQIFKTNIRMIEEKLSSIDCKIVMATITTMSFVVWNNIRLQQGKTSYLLLDTHYDNMQEMLNEILNKINSYITEYNTGNGFVTPFLHTPVHKYNKGRIRYVYSKLIDGVHPGIELRDVWIRRLNSVFGCNESKLNN